MIWKNLLQNRCPKCGYRLEEHPAQALWRCPGCDFVITDTKRQSLETDLTLDQMDQEREGGEY